MNKRILIALFVLPLLFACTNKNSQKSEDASDTIVVVEKDSLQLAMESIFDESSMYLFVGTYTSGESEGIYVYQFDTISGYSKYLSMAKVDNPSYLTISPNEKFVYSVTENADNTSAVNAFSFDKTEGKLKLLNTKFTGGGAPCYIEIDKSGKHIITANYLGGNISLFETNDDGSLKPSSNTTTFQGRGIDSTRQTQPHLHCVKFSPDGKHLFASDLGTDKIYKFDINTSSPGNYMKIGSPASYKLKDGSGPRHITFHPNGKFAYLITELSGDVIAFDYNEGNLTEIQIMKADTLNAQGSADIHVSPDGRYLYASNRLQGDGIAIFSINQNDGKLTKIGYQETGVHPRNFAIAPNGRYLLCASRDSDIIQIFEIDRKTGLLENVYKDIRLDMPVCIKFAGFK